MKHWRSKQSRLFWLIAGMLGAIVALSGCMGGKTLRHESWPGLMVNDGILYAANLERVQALDAETGKWYWSYPPESDTNLRPFYSTPVLAPDAGANGLLLMAGFKDRVVYALELGESPTEQPDLAWTFPPANATTPGAAGQYVGSGTVAGDLFLIGNGDGKVYALNLADGALVWTFTTKDRVWAAPVVKDDVVYIAALDHHLYAVELTSGKELWQLETQGALAATPVFVGDYLWVGDFAKTLYQIDLETHTAVWTYDAADWVWATPVVDNNILYFADVGGHVYALDTETRTMLWDNPAVVDDSVRGRPVLSAAGDLLYLAGYEKGAIHVLDTETGDKMNWGVELANPGRLPGDLVADDSRLYTMPIWVKERLRVFELETGKVAWIYPPTDSK